MKNTLLFFSILAALILVSACNKLKVTPDNGNGWATLGNSAPDSGLIAMAADHKGYVYIAGKYSGSADLYHVEKWNGIAWSELNGLNAQTNITGLAADGNNNIYAAIDAMATDSGYVAEWNGSSWTKLADSVSGKIVGGHISTMVINNSNYLFALVNNNEIECWNGGRWTNMTAGDTLFLNCNMTSLGADLWGDIFTGINPGSAYPGVAEWDGSKWSLVGNLVPNNKILVVTSDVHNFVYAAGKFTNKAGNNFVSQGDGTKWAELSGLNTLNANGDIMCIVTDINANIFAAGAMLDKNGNYYISRWNGRSWAELSSGIAMNAPLATMTIDKGGSIYVIAYNKSSKKNVVAMYNQ